MYVEPPQTFALVPKKRLRFSAAVVAFMAGMTGQLYQYLPGLGTMAMLDIVSYPLSIILVMINWRRMGKYMRRAVWWGVAWTIAAMVANSFCFIEFRFWAKCVAIAASSWVLMVVAFVVLRIDSRMYLWYLVGTGIGGWISLYHFSNGTYVAFMMQSGADSIVEGLQEKQIYPYVARGILYGIVFPFFIWIRKLPVLFSVIMCFVAGFYLLMHGGARSEFGMFVLAGLAGFLLNYQKRSMKMLLKHPTLVLMAAGLAGMALFLTYKTMAQRGALGASETKKYEQQFDSGEESQGGIASRAGIASSWYWISKYPLGAGGMFRNHSVIFNALSCEGPIGFFFWVYFYSQMLWLVCKRGVLLGRFAPYVLLTIFSECWHVLGSPFGGRHFYFFLLTLSALCRDNPGYGRGTLFER